MTSPAAAIAVLATLDTKGAEAAYVRERFLAQGHRPILVDIGTAGEPTIAADVTRADIAAAAGRGHDPATKSEAMAAVVDGTVELLRGLLREGRLAGVFGFGGGQGTWLAASVMRSLPLGLPKVLVTTIAARAPVHVQDSDIVMVPSVVDIAGLNRILAPTLAGAVGAVLGMAAGRAGVEDAGEVGTLVAMTMFGVTTAGGEHVRAALARSGREVAVFHANGNGGRVLEKLVHEGRIGAVLDWTTTELADEVAGGIAGAGPGRLEAAGQEGIPQLIVPGAIDVINFGAPETVPARYAGRLLHQHTPLATLMRTNADEAREIGRLMAGKLGKATGPVRVLIPDGGFSALDAPGQPFHDPVADGAFVDALTTHLPPGIEVEHSDLHINDAAFAELAASRFLDLSSDIV
jgi:uncharacterized protein (UPF0261 family)